MTLYLYETRFGNTKKLAEMTRSYDLDPNSVVAEMDGWTYNDYTWNPVYKFPDTDQHIEDPRDSLEPVVLFVPTYENIKEQRLTGEPLQYASKDSLVYAEMLALKGRLVGVVVAGNRNFGSKFCEASKDFEEINRRVNPNDQIRILREVEIFGDPSDWRAVAKEVEVFNEQR